MMGREWYWVKAGGQEVGREGAKEIKHTYQFKKLYLLLNMLPPTLAWKLKHACMHACVHACMHACKGWGDLFELHGI